MNIKTANRLLEYRKKAGFSQEELAEKIGVSRQAVSKWERSEASPDTDNLVMLAELYGVSLDEMLGLKPAKNEATEELPEKDEVHVSLKGIHVHSKEGDKVDVSFKEGIHVVSKGEEKVHILGNEKYYVDGKGEKHEIKPAYYFWLYLPFPVIIIALFLGWGFSGLWGGWSTAWLAFFLIPVYYSLIEAIKAKDMSKFAFPVLAVGGYLAVGMFMHIWHPTWLILLSIPVYYCIAEGIKKIRKNKREDEEA